MLLIILGIGAIAYAGLIYTQAEPTSRPVFDRTNQQTFRTELGTSAVVVNDTLLYDSGTELEDEPVYLDRSTPTASLELETSVSPGRSLTVTHRYVVVYNATYGGEPFWNRTETLAEYTETATDGVVRTSTELDVPAVRERVSTLRGALGVSENLDLSVNVVATASYETDSYSGRHRLETSPSIGPGWYSVPGASQSSSRSQQERRTVTEPPDRGPYLEWGVAGGVLFVGGVVVSVLYRVKYRHLDPEELERQLQRSRYADMISRGTVRREYDGAIEIEDLESIVEVGFDTNSRVVHDRATGRYVVVDGDVVYFYDPERTGEHADGDPLDTGDGSTDWQPVDGNEDERAGSPEDGSTDTDHGDG